MKYVVLEFLEDDPIRITVVSSHKKAVKLANKRLKVRMANIGRMEEYESKDGEHEDWGKANKQNNRSWCYFRDNWNCYVFALKKGLFDRFLDIPVTM